MDIADVYEIRFHEVGWSSRPVEEVWEDNIVVNFAGWWTVILPLTTLSVQ